MNANKKYDIEVLYQLYYQDVYRYVLFINFNASDAEDIVQNTFLKAMKGLAGFRSSCHVKTWLLTIARNESIRYAVKAKTSVPLDVLPETTASICIEDSYCTKEAAGYILDYIKNCPEPKKSLLVFHLIENLSFVEIGSILGKSDTWCRVTYMRAKNDILKELEVQYE